jgi:hypothetical protein
MENKKIEEFAKKVLNQFDKYFIGYSFRQNGKIVNVFIDDRDVVHMTKQDIFERVLSVLDGHAKDVGSLKINLYLASDINSENVWEILLDESRLYNVNAFSSFAKINMPKEFMYVYSKLPNKFKLHDIMAEMSKLTEHEYHRNTYQKWLKTLKDAGFTTLKNRTYHKIDKPYKKALLEAL